MGGSKVRDTVILVLVVLLAVGGIAAFGFYRDEVTAYLRLQAWDLGPVVRGTRQFVDAAASGDGARIQPLLARDCPAQPIMKNGRLTGFSLADYGGPKAHKLKEMVPTSSVQVKKPELIYLDGGAVVTEIAVPGSHGLKFRWDRRPEGWRIIDITWIQDVRSSQAGGA